MVKNVNTQLASYDNVTHRFLHLRFSLRTLSFWRLEYYNFNMLCLCIVEVLLTSFYKLVQLNVIVIKLYLITN